ncbi:MAG: hypothetical protein WC644_09060 [Ignavibacteria bacterium]
MKYTILHVLILLMFVLYSCGKNEQKPEQNSSGKTEVSTDSAKLNSQDNKEVSTTGNELGLQVGLPKDFPKDVPQPPNSNCVGSIVNQTEGTTVTFSSNAKVLDIASFYKEELKKNGFKSEPGMEDLINEKGGMLKWSKAERDVELMMSFNSESNSTDIVLSYKEKK